MNPSPFLLAPEYREYVWGGAKLRPQVVPTAEAWIVYAGNRVSSGQYAGQTLEDLTKRFRADLLGKRALPSTGGRFPVLIKLLDPAQWLSVQVHPNDEQARQLEGAGSAGKTEAWHIIESEPNASLLAGIKPNVSAAALQEAIRNGTITDCAQTFFPKTGETLFIPAGTLHALGPGLLIYEIQQESDITYRVYDWGRPQSATRKLHIEQALAVCNPNAQPQIIAAPSLLDGEAKTLTECEYFKLEILQAGERAAQCQTGGESFHALTLLEGQSQIRAGQESFLLKKLETLFIPACCGAYEITPLQNSRLLRASL